jgi:hypothetical protein
MMMWVEKCEYNYFNYHHTSVDSFVIGYNPAYPLNALLCN